MATKQSTPEQKSGVSKIQLAVGAASLFLFIVGLKRSFKVDDGKSGAAPSRDSRPPAQERRRTGTNAAK